METISKNTRKHTARIFFIIALTAMLVAAMPFALGSSPDLNVYAATTKHYTGQIQVRNVFLHEPAVLEWHVYENNGKIVKKSVKNLTEPDGYKSKISISKVKKNTVKVSGTGFVNGLVRKDGMQNVATFKVNKTFDYHKYNKKAIIVKG